MAETDFQFPVIRIYYSQLAASGYLTVCHGIDGPNRNRWFTVLKNGGIFHGELLSDQRVPLLVLVKSPCLLVKPQWFQVSAIPIPPWPTRRNKVRNSSALLKVPARRLKTRSCGHGFWSTKIGMSIGHSWIPLCSIKLWAVGSFACFLWDGLFHWVRFILCYSKICPAARCMLPQGFKKGDVSNKHGLLNERGFC